jgi:hypothetical protein
MFESIELLDKVNRLVDDLGRRKSLLTLSFGYGYEPSAFDQIRELRAELDVIKKHLGICVAEKPARKEVVECGESKQRRKK